MVRGAAMVQVLVTLAAIWGVITGAGPRILTEIIDGGFLSYAGTTMVIILGAWMAETLVQTGIAQRLIRNAAELAGDCGFALQ
jgi:H+/gluconate symporter-like permease